MAGLGLASALFVAALGAIVSLRAATVRQAQQTLSGAILVLFVLPVAAARWIPDAWKPAAIALATLDPGTVALGAIALAAVDGALVLVARARFQRARIITS